MLCTLLPASIPHHPIQSSREDRVGMRGRGWEEEGASGGGWGGGEEWGVGWGGKGRLAEM